MRQSSYDIPKKNIQDFIDGTFIKHKDEAGKPMITLPHAYFMAILEEKERFRKQAMRRKK